MMMGCHLAVGSPEEAPEPLVVAKPESEKKPVKTVVVALDIYRVNGSFAGSTSLTDGIWQGIDSPTAEEKKEFTYFTEADVEVVGLRLKAKETGWLWDGKEGPDKTDKVEIVAAPQVKSVVDGSRIEIRIGGKSVGFRGDLSGWREGLRYFEKHPGGIYFLKEGMAELGLRVAMNLEEGEGGRIVLRDLNLEFRSLEPVDTDLFNKDVVIVTKRESTTTVSLLPEKYYGLLIRTEGEGLMIVRLRLTPGEAKAA